MRLTIDQRLPLSPDALTLRLAALLTALARQVNGISEGSIAAVHNAQLAPPTTGTWKAGDFVRNAEPVDDGSGATIFGWVCVLNGTPGTWLPIGGGAGGGGTVADGDYGDIVVSGTGSTWSIDSAVLSSFARTLIDDTSAAAARTTLGLAIGSNVQAWDTDLDALAALARAQGDVIFGGASAWQRLPAGAKRRALTTRGTGADPVWDAMSVRAVATATFTLADADVGQWLDVDASSTAVATLSTASGYAVGESTIFSQRGAGQVQLVAGSGVKLRAAPSAKTRAVDSVIAATRLADEGGGTAVFSVFGDTA